MNTSHLFHYLTPLADKVSLTHLSESILPPFRNLPHHNKPPPDSDIAQLWEEVRKRVASIIDPSDEVSEPNRMPTVTSKRPRLCSQLSNPNVKVLPTYTPPESLDEHLEVKPTTGNPQYTHILDEDHETKHYKLDNNPFHYKLTTALLAYRPEAKGCLGNSTETQDTSISTRHDPQRSPSLSHLDFTSTRDPSKEFVECIFYLDVRNTLSNMGHLRSTTIPSTVIGKNRPGPSFLYLLCSDQDSTNIAENWMADAQEELTKQLRIQPVDLVVEERLNVMSRLRHFCYLMKNSQLEVCEMKIRICHARGLGSTASTASSKISQNEKNPSNKPCSSSVTPQIGFSVPPKRPRQMKTLPRDLPCECRTLYAFNLDSDIDRMKFYDVNKAIQKWGQAKHGMEYMNNLIRLLNREGYDDGLMNGEELQQYLQGIVFPSGTTVNCL